MNYTNRRDIVKSGYDQIESTYLAACSKDSEDFLLLKELVD